MNVQEAWAEALEALPDGWCLSVTHVPAPAQWGATASPVVPPFKPLVQTGTCHSEAEALRMLAWQLRQIPAEELA